jgi:hypothetical protein
MLIFDIDFSVASLHTNDKFSQASDYEISPFGRNDPAGAGIVGGQVGRFAPDLSSQKLPHECCHFDQNTQRSEVLPGEIYSPMSLPQYAQKIR